MIAKHSRAVATALLVLCIFVASTTIARAADATTKPTNHVTVSPHGTANFKTITEAIAAVPDDNTEPFTIEVMPGTYKEHLLFPKNKPYIILLGHDAEKTILTFNNTHATLDANKKMIGTGKSASVFIQGSDFLAENITFQNGAGPAKENGQAVAINIDGDRSVFFKCRFDGWQDTLYTHSSRQYFQDCFIEGHVDFIFGFSTDWFENCEMHCRAGGSITAPSTPQTAKYGYVFDHCKITQDDSLKPASVILARPWRPYGSSYFLHVSMPDCITPEGYNKWYEGSDRTARFAEFDSSGPGALLAKRLSWIRVLTPDQAAKITISSVLAGSDHWNPLAELPADAQPAEAPK